MDSNLSQDFYMDQDGFRTRPATPDALSLFSTTSPPALGVGSATTESYPNNGAVEDDGSNGNANSQPISYLTHATSLVDHNLEDVDPEQSLAWMGEQNQSSSIGRAAAKTKSFPKLQKLTTSTSAPTTSSVESDTASLSHPTRSLSRAQVQRNYRLRQKQRTATLANRCEWLESRLAVVENENAKLRQQLAAALSNQMS